jgi:hypothetical protein
MNAAIRSVVRTCAYHHIDCIGFIEVEENDRILKMETIAVKSTIVSFRGDTGKSTILSVRHL